MYFCGGAFLRFDEGDDMKSHTDDGTVLRLVDVSAAARRRLLDWRFRRIGKFAVPVAWLLGFNVVALLLRNVLSDWHLELAELVGAVAAAGLTWYALYVRLPEGPSPRRFFPGRNARLGGWALLWYLWLASFYWGFFALFMFFAVFILMFLVNVGILLLVVVLSLLIAGRVFRYMRSLVFRFAERSSPNAVARDGRPPVLFLRSFDLDEARIRGAHRSLGTRGRSSFEAVLFNRLWQVGPVIAAARPIIDNKLGEAVLNEKTNELNFERDGKIIGSHQNLAPLGGHRWRLRSGDWQTYVDSWLQRAALVVVVIGGSGGLNWELDRIRVLERARQLLIVVPPPESMPMFCTADGDERHLMLGRLWESTARHLADPRVNLPRSIDTRKTRLIVPGIDRAAVVITSAGTDSHDYEAALDAALPFYVGGR
jgi:hypothetical protein